MAWIEVHQSVWSHRKTLLLADTLGLSPLYAAAHMIHLWTWALDNAPSGDLTGLPARVITVGAGWTSDPETFVRATVDAGYLERTGDCLRVHDWGDYAGRLVIRREQQRERMRNARAQNARSTDAERAQLPNPTVPDQTTPYQEEKHPPSPQTVPIKQSAAYREFEETCRDGHLDSWLTFTAFDQLHRTATSVDGREWEVLIEVAKEAALAASGRPPNAVFGTKILTNLPPHVLTRTDAQAHFENRRSGNGNGGAGPPPQFAYTGPRPKSTDEAE